jgi:hypothetical protein
MRVRADHCRWPGRHALGTADRVAVADVADSEIRDWREFTVPVTTAPTCGAWNQDREAFDHDRQPLVELAARLRLTSRLGEPVLVGPVAPKGYSTVLTSRSGHCFAR